MAVLGLRTDRAIEQLRLNPKEAEEILRSITGDILQLSLGLREVSHRLHPSMLEDLGLIAALRNLVAGFRDDLIDVSFRFPDEIPAMSADATTALFRIAQEALRNALKHAPGAPVHVTLGAEPNSAQLTIRDDGPGFDLTKVRLEGGLGILNMNERQASYWSPAPPFAVREGTVVSVAVPVEMAH